MLNKDELAKLKTIVDMTFDQWIVTQEPPFGECFYVRELGDKKYITIINHPHETDGDMNEHLGLNDLMLEGYVNLFARLQKWAHCYVEKEEKKNG